MKSVNTDIAVGVNCRVFEGTHLVSDSKDGKSITWIVTASVILVAYLGWGFMAGSYAGSSGGAIHFGPSSRISAVYSFVITSITQLPSFFSVIGWHLSNRIWLPLLFVILEVAVIAGGVGLNRLEQSLEGNKKRPRR